MLVLNDKQVKGLEDFIQDLPVRYGIPLLNLIRTYVQENQAKENTKSVEPESKKEEIQVEAE